MKSNLPPQDSAPLSAAENKTDVPVVPQANGLNEANTAGDARSSSYAAGASSAGASAAGAYSSGVEEPNSVGGPKNISLNGGRGGRSLNDPFATALSQDDEATINWREIFTMLRRRRRIIGAVFASVVLLGLLVTRLTKPVYQAVATLELIIPQQAGGSSNELPGLTDLLDNTRARSLATQVAVIQSGGVLEAARKRLPSAAAETIGRFNRLDVQPISETDIIGVTVQSNDPTAASDYAKAICAEYIAQSKKQSRENINAATSYVNDRLDLVRIDLDKARGALRDFQNKNKTINLVVEADSGIKVLGNAQAALAEFLAEQQADAAELSALRTNMAKLAPTLTSPSGIVRNTSVEAMKANLTELELERVKQSKEYAPGSEIMQSLDSRISTIRSNMAKEAQTQIASWAIRDNPVHALQAQTAAALQAKVWANESKARALRSSLENQKVQLAKVPALQYRFSQLMTDMQTLQNTYELLNEKSISLRLQQESSAPAARLLPGAIFGEKISPRTMSNLLGSIILGLVISIALAALIDRLDDRVHSQQDAEHSSGLPILAQIPYLQDKTQQSLLGNMNESTALLESYRMLRTNIEFSSLGQPLRSIVVTSTQPNEGKSTTTADLAIAMALDDKKVILVDADLRRPTLHELFNLPNRIGFTNVVAKTATLEEALQETPVPGLYFLSSGPAPPNPTELLNSRSARAVWAQIINECDLALIDTPPALVMADAQIVTSLMDAVILVISMQEAGRRDIERTSALLGRTGTPVLGAVLNKTRAENNDYYYNKNRYYGAYVKK